MAGGRQQEAGEVSEQGDLHGPAGAIAERFDLDLLHQSADIAEQAAVQRRVLGRHVPAEMIAAGDHQLQGRLQLADLGGVGVGGLGVERDQIPVRVAGGGLGVEIGEPGRDLDLLALLVLEPDLHRRRVGSVADRVHDPVDGSVEFGQAALQRGPVGPLLGRLSLIGRPIGLDIGPDAGGRQEAAPEAVQHAQFDMVAPHGPIVVAERRAALAVAGAHQAIRALQRVGRAAPGAFQQAAEQARPVTLGEVGRAQAGVAVAAGLGAGPEILGHDPQLGDRRAFPFGLGLHDRGALAGDGIFLHQHPVPDLHAGIELGLKDPIAALAAAADRAGVPPTAPRAAQAGAIELVGDLAGAEVLVGVELEDPHDHLGLGRDHGHLAAGRRAIAEQARAGGQALLGVGGHAASGLLAEIDEIELVHQTLEGHVQDLDLIGVQGGDPDAGVAQPVEHVRLMFEVPGQAILILDQHQVEGARLGGGEQTLQARPVGHGRAADRRVGEGGHHGPALAHGVRGADVDLVGDGALVLAVGAVAGVEGGAHGRLDHDELGGRAARLDEQPGAVLCDLAPRIAVVESAVIRIIMRADEGQGCVLIASALDLGDLRGAEPNLEDHVILAMVGDRGVEAGLQRRGHAHAASSWARRWAA